jgi:very-short-patch-repair endonuclease
MREIPEVAADQFGVFTAAQAYWDGWTSHALRHAVATGALIRLRRGAFARPAAGPMAAAARGSGATGDIPALVRESVAASLTVDAAVVSHQAAAYLYGLPVLGRQRPCVTVDGRVDGDVPGVHLHRSDLAANEQATRAEVRLTSPARTIVDVAREHGVGAGLAAADAAMRSGLLTVNELADCVEGKRGLPAIRFARAVVRVVDGRAESPLESLSRWQLICHGFSGFDLQRELWTSSGAWLARVDFYFEDGAVIGEADGLMKYDSPEVLRQEKLRQERLADAGYEVVRWGWRDLRDFGTVAARIRRAQHRNSGRVPADSGRAPADSGRAPRIAAS